MPNRIIHEKATMSATLDALTDGAERMFWRLTTKADDHGRFDADPRVLLAACFPRKIDTLKPATVERWRDEMTRAGLIRLYTLGERIYGMFCSWNEHQRARDSKPKYPAPEDGTPYMPPDAASRGKSPRDAAYARAGVSRVESRESRVESREPSTTCPPPHTAAEDAAGAASNGHRPRLADTWATAKWPSPEALAHRFNTLTPEYVAAVDTLTAKRREKAWTALRQCPAEDWWTDLFREYHRSRFLSGKSPPREGHKRFQPDFDWLLANGKDKSENYVKVHDGKYRD